MTKDTLKLFLELLAQVRISPMQQDSDIAWSRVTKAKQEIEKDLQSE